MSLEKSHIGGQNDKHRLARKRKNFFLPSMDSHPEWPTACIPAVLKQFGHVAFSGRILYNVRSC